MSNAVTAVASRQPSIATRPARESRAKTSGAAPEGACQHLSEARVDLAVLQQSGAKDNPVRPHRQDFLRRFQTANPAAHLTIKLLHNLLHQHPVIPAATGCVQVDDLHDGILRESLDPIVKVVKLQHFLLALHQLHNLAAHQID